MLIEQPGADRHPALFAKALSDAAAIDNWLDDQTRADALYERAMPLHEALDDWTSIVGIVRALGNVAIDRGNLDRAESLLVRARHLGRQHGVAWETAAATNLLGVVAFARGNYPAAITAHIEAATGWRELGDHGHVLTALVGLGLSTLAYGQLTRATEALAEVIDRTAGGEDDATLGSGLLGAGGLAVAAGDPERGTALLSVAAAIRQRSGTPLRAATQERHDGVLAQARTELGATRFADAWAAGQLLPLPEAIASARAIFTTVSTPAARLPDQRGLTRRQRDVLRLLAEGRSDREIAATLFISRRSASQHVSAILGKLGVSSRTAAAAVALRDRLI